MEREDAAGQDRRDGDDDKKSFGIMDKENTRRLTRRRQWNTEKEKEQPEATVKQEFKISSRHLLNVLHECLAPSDRCTVCEQYL